MYFHFVTSSKFTSEWRPFSSTHCSILRQVCSLSYTAFLQHLLHRVFLYPAWCTVSSIGIRYSWGRDYLPDGMLRERSRHYPETQRFAVVIRWHPVQNHCTALFHVPSHSDCRDFLRSVDSSYLSFEVYTSLTQSRCISCSVFFARTYIFVNISASRYHYQQRGSNLYYNSVWSSLIAVS